MRFVTSVFILSFLASLAMDPVAAIPGLNFKTPFMNIIAYGPKVETPDGGVIAAELPQVVPKAPEVTDKVLVDLDQESATIEKAQEQATQSWIGSFWSATKSTTAYICNCPSKGMKKITDTTEQGKLLLKSALTIVPDALGAKLKAVCDNIKNQMSEKVNDVFFPADPGLMRKALYAAANILNSFIWFDVTSISNIKVSIVLPQIKTAPPYGVGFLVTDFQATINGNFKPPKTIKAIGGKIDYTFGAAGINVLGTIINGKFVISDCEGAIYSSVQFKEGEGVLGGAIKVADKLSFHVQSYVNEALREAVCGATTLIINASFTASQTVASLVLEFAKDPAAYATKQKDNLKRLVPGWIWN